MARIQRAPSALGLTAPWTWRGLSSIVSGLLSPSCCQRTDLQHANHLAKIGSRIWLTI